jgi:hypothetical protein
MSATEKEIVAGQYIKDEDRSAFGLGYEYARRSRPLDDNPFPLGNWKHALFSEGWRTRHLNSKGK